MVQVYYYIALHSPISRVWFLLTTLGWWRRLMYRYHFIKLELVQFITWDRKCSVSYS